MNNTQLTSFTPSLRTFKAQSPPSKALAAYAKASEQTMAAPVDSVDLSAAAKEQPSGVSGMRKTASAFALGIALLGAFGAQGAMAADTAPQVEEVSQYEQAGQEVRDIGLEIGRQGKEVGLGAAKIGKEIGREAADVGKEIGRQGARVGRQIGRQGAKVGKGVGRAAKGFWRGLTGKSGKK